MSLTNETDDDANTRQKGDGVDELTLHNSDHPNYSLSTCLLNERNYSHWKRSVEISLSAKNKLGFIDGTCARPTVNGVDTRRWDRCNSMVIAWILHSVESDIAESLIYCKTASQMWKELASRFGKSNRTRIYQVQRDLLSHSQGNTSVTTYFTKMKKLWDEYLLLVESCACDCGSSVAIWKIMTDQQVVQFLMGLNDNYNSVRGNLLMMMPPPNLDQVYQIVLAEEHQRNIGTHSSGSTPADTESLALAAQRNAQRFSQSSTNNSGASKPRLYCDHCKAGGHSMEKCWKLHGYPTTPPTDLHCDHCKMKGHTTEKCWKLHAGKSESRFFCEHCKVAGHTVDRCWKIHGYPSGKGPKVAAQASSGSTPSYSLTGQQYEQLMSLLNKHSSNESVSHAAFLAGPFDEQAHCDWP